MLGSDDTFGKKLILNYLKNYEYLIQLNITKLTTLFENFSEISQIDFLKYESNSYDSGYIFHVDHAAKAPERALSISICLNNKFEGVSLFLIFKEKNIECTKCWGLCYLFLPNFLYPHQVNKITYGTRYAIVAWVI